MLSCFRPNCFRTGISLEFPSRCGNLVNKLVPQNSVLPLNKLSVLRVCVISESKQATALIQERQPEVNLGVRRQPFFCFEITNAKLD
jgi:hypothetical protein